MKKTWNKVWLGTDPYGNIKVRKTRAKDKLKIFEKMGFSYLGIDTITDFGAGGGYVSAELIKRINKSSLSIELLEITDSGIKMSKEKFTNNQNIKVTQADISKPLNFQNKSDLAIAFSVLEHIEDIKTGIENIYSVLKEKGKLLLIWSHENSVFCKQREEAMKKGSWAYGYQKEINEIDLIKFFGEKFDIKKTKIVPCFGYKGFLTLRDKLSHILTKNKGRYIFAIMEKR